MFVRASVFELVVLLVYECTHFLFLFLKSFPWVFMRIFILTGMKMLAAPQN